MNPLLICNRHSRGGRSAALCRLVFGELDAQGFLYDHEFTRDMDHARSLSLQANREGRPLVVAVGGDGTISRALNGFYDGSGRRLSNRTRFGVIHTGTSPDFCRSHGIPTDMTSAARTVVVGRARPVRVGCIQYSSAGTYDPAVRTVDDLAVARTSYFGCCANAGLGASLARAANGGIRSYVGDTVGTLLCLLALLVRFRPHPYAVSVDGSCRNGVPLYNVSVGRTRCIASGIQVNHELDPLDDRLYVVSVRRFGPARLPRVLKALYSGRPLPRRGVVSLAYGRCVDVHNSPTNREVEFDGDPAGCLPCRITVARDTLDLVCGGSTC